MAGEDSPQRDLGGQLKITEDARGNAVRVEGLQSLQFFSCAHKLDGLAGHRLHAQRRSAAAVTVHLCENGACSICNARIFFFVKMFVQKSTLGKERRVGTSLAVCLSF